MTILEHNVETGAVIEREMTKDELAQHKADLAAIQAEQDEAKAKAAARQAILDRLGITAEEAKLILQ